jgi:hypothetical protein
MKDSVPLLKGKSSQACPTLTPAGFERQITFFSS